MSVFDIAVIGFVLFGMLAAGSLLALLKQSWRQRAWLGLKTGLAGFIVAMGIAMLTSPPKEVLQAEAAARAAQAEHASRVKAEKAPALAEAKPLAEHAAPQEPQKQDAARAADEAAAKEARLKQLRADAIAASANATDKAKAGRTTVLESHIDWSNKLWALSVLSASMIKSGDLDGLADARYKAGELFLEASGWTASDAKLAFLCSQAADALKNAIIAARDGNMSGRVDSYATQMKRWDSHHNQCSATARELRGEPPLNKAKTKTSG